MSNTCPISTEKDFDGMPLAPQEVYDNSAWAVFRCAKDQAKTWLPPTPKESRLQNMLLTAFRDSKVNGISTTTTEAMLDAADKLGCQMMRVKKSDTDSFLLVFTKKGVRDYNGCFMMLRETSSSKVVLIVPHDGSDGTHTDTKLALANSKALAVISNGHPKGIDKMSDFVDHSNTMGSKAVSQLQQLFGKLVFLMIHGQANDKSILYRSRDKGLGRAFQEACTMYTGMKKFNSFNADYATDKVVKSNLYLKTEMPAKIHVNNLRAMGKIVCYIEQYAWAWPTEEETANFGKTVIDDNAIDEEVVDVERSQAEIETDVESGEEVPIVPPEEPSKPKPTKPVKTRSRKADN